MTDKSFHNEDSGLLDIPTGSHATSSVASPFEQPMLFDTHSAGASGGRLPSSESSANPENTPMSASPQKGRKLSVPKLPVLKAVPKNPPPPEKPAVEPPGAGKTTPQYPCICPGEKYPITHSVCLGRQSRNFDRCLHCEFHLEERLTHKRDYRER